MTDSRAAVAVLRGAGLVRTLGPSVILNGVDVTVGPDTRLGVVGRNGVGKSTLLRLLAGLDSPDSGTVTITPPDATVGYLAQEVERREESVNEYLARCTGVFDAERALQASSTELADGVPGADERYARALDRYVSLGAADFEARADSALDEVGLSPALGQRAMAALSGGQAGKAALAAVLLSRFDVLLLDEPTNNLDFSGLARLEQFLERVAGGWAVVSHDRSFLARTVNGVLELDEHSRQAREYGGGWTAYLEARAVSRRHAKEAYEQYESTRDALVQRAQTQRQWAVQGVRREGRAPRDNDKAQRGFRINRTEKLAAKARASERALERLDPVEKPWEGWNLDLRIAQAERSGAVVARLDRVVVDRGSFVLGPVDLEVSWGDRIAVTGPNGSGKTTLLDVIVGRVEPTTGARWMGPSVVVGELDQGRSLFAAEAPLVEVVTAASGLVPQETRSLLAKFDLGAEHVARSSASLSPGERTRATLALFMARGVNCLVLDEPTNHLDLPAIEQLEQALSTFDGTVLLVTHDRELLAHVATTRQLEVGDGRVRER